MYKKENLISENKILHKLQKYDIFFAREMTKKLEGIELIVNLIALIQEWKWAKIYLVRKVDFLFVN